jgi:SAM-dependent methyltransferase
MQKIIQFINFVILWLKRKRKIKLFNGPIKVNVGSGFTVAPNWINIDGNFNLLFKNFPIFILKLIYKYTGIKKWMDLEHFIKTLKSNKFIHHNVLYGLPFHNETVDFVYSSHLLEHLFKEDAFQLLKEIYRVLKKGGLFRLCIPDMNYVLNLYQNGKKQEALKYLFPESKADYFSRHRYMYDFETISEILKEVGFKEITKQEYRQGSLPDVEKLDNRPFESLHLEAKK